MRITQKRLVKEYKRIAEKYGIPEELVKDIEAFQWRFVRDNIAKGIDTIESFENIYLRYFGTFYASKNILKHIKKNKEEEND